MKRKNVLTIVALIAVFALMLAGCGTTEPAETTAPAETAPLPLGLRSWSMNATTWSSPNGATVNLTATPNSYAEGQSAIFSIRLEGEEILNVPCQWDGTSYTAAAELNAADGYCYYVLLTGADGATAEVAVNTPTTPSDESLINMESALDAYCSASVQTSALNGKTLTITAGSAQIQLPTITRAEGAVVCSEAVLTLMFNGEVVEEKALTVTEADATGMCTIDLADTRFTIPEMEDDQQLVLQLDVKLSNGQPLNAPAGTWFYTDGNLVTAVG